MQGIPHFSTEVEQNFSNNLSLMRTGCFTVFQNAQVLSRGAHVVLGKEGREKGRISLLYEIIGVCAS